MHPTPIAHYLFGQSLDKSTANLGSDSAIVPSWIGTASPSGPHAYGAFSMKLSSQNSFAPGIKMGRVGGFTAFVSVELVAGQFCLIAGGGSQTAAPQMDFGPQLYFGAGVNLLQAAGCTDPAFPMNPGWQVVGFSLAPGGAVKIYAGGRGPLISSGLVSVNVAPSASRDFVLGGGHYLSSPSNIQHRFAEFRAFPGVIADDQVASVIVDMNRSLFDRGANLT